MNLQKIFRDTLLMVLSVAIVQVVAQATAQAAVPVAWQWQAAELSGAINVRDFGAVGDGVHDDTQAIQAALTFQNKNRRLIQIGSFNYITDAVLIPKGTYLLTDLIRAGPSAVILGEPGSVLRQTNPNVPVLDVDWSTRIELRGLTFEGGREGVHFYTHNVAASIYISDCTFRNTAGAAVHCVMRAYDPQNLTGRYKRNKETEQWEYVGSDAKNYYNSAMLRVTRSRFEDCAKVLVASADGTVFDQNEVVYTKPWEGAVCEMLSSTGRIDRVKFSLTSDQRTDDMRWIDFFGSLRCTDSSFVVENGPGVCAIKVQRQWHNNHQKGLTRVMSIEGCEFDASDSPQGAIVDAAKLPNVITMRRCVERRGRVAAVRFVELSDLERLKKMPNHVASFDFDRNSKNITTKLPRELAEFRAKPLDARTNQAMNEALHLDIENELETGSPEYFVFTTDSEGRRGKRDISRELQAVVAQAQEATLPIVVIPTGLYRADQSIDLPKNIMVMAGGVAEFIGEANPLFNVPRVERVTLRNLVFAQMPSVVVASEPVGDEALLRIEHCYLTENPGIAFQVGTAQTPGPRLHVTDTSVWRKVRQLIEYHGPLAVYDNGWWNTDEQTTEGASIVNHGTLVLRNVLGNPYCMQSVDARWIDNHGDVVADSTRFGGEFGGMCLIVHRKAGGRIFVQGSWLFALRNPVRMASIYLEERPDMVVVRDSIGLIGRHTYQLLRGVNHVGPISEDARWLHLNSNTIVPPSEN